MLKVSFDNLSFLIVDDSAFMRTIVRTILMGFGARRIYEAQDGADGLEKLDQHSPDIVITDWEMPVLNGPEMISMIRKPGISKHAYVPIILLTAHTERARMVQAKTLGVNEIVRKPMAPTTLYKHLVAVVLYPRPFVRTTTYFGPEPREEATARARETEPQLVAID